MKKNVALIFFSLIFSAILTYFLVFTWVFAVQKYKDKNNFTNLKNLNFHIKLSNKVHHLRGHNWPHHKREMFWKKEDYLFTVFSKFDEDKDNYLIQGDSWAEYIVFKDLINKSLQNIVEKRGIGLINSGISSYSPSPMKVQFEILEEKYDFKPDYLISIIDQTDIGDELCRYKHNIVEKENGTVSHIKREFNTGAVMDASKYYTFSRIILENKRFINFHITNYYFLKTFNEIKTRIFYIKKLGLQDSKSYQCRFQEIQKYLYNLNEKDKNYFKKRTQEYFDFLNSKKYLKKVFVVTFPHEKHLNGEYKVNVSKIINELDFNSKIVHINFNDIIQKNQFQKDNIYGFNDPASHLKEEAHALYIKKIFEIIEKKKN